MDKLTVEEVVKEVLACQEAIENKDPNTHILCDYGSTFHRWPSHHSIIVHLARQNQYMKMRLAQIASGDYKTCGHRAEEVAADALNPNKEQADG